MQVISYENYQEKRPKGDSAFPYVTYPCSIPLDFSKVPLHWHDEMELVYIKKGAGIVSVDFTRYHVTMGDILVILPGRLHSIEQEPGASMEYENIIFRTSMITSLHDDVCTEEFFLPMLQHQLLIPTYLQPDCGFYEEAAACLNRADRLCDSRPIAYQLSVKSQLLQFFFVLFSHAAPQKEEVRNRKSLEKIKLILRYIEDSYARNLTIKEMAEACGFSQSHFMKFFKQTVGTSFTAYLNRYRLIVASGLLLSSSASILEIAGETGFENLSYFNRTFKATFGMTPKEFRRTRG